MRVGGMHQRTQIKLNASDRAAVSHYRLTGIPNFFASAFFAPPQISPESFGWRCDGLCGSVSAAAAARLLRALGTVGVDMVCILANTSTRSG
jgi:hypothetical protein